MKFVHVLLVAVLAFACGSGVRAGAGIGVSMPGVQAGGCRGEGFLRRLLSWSSCSTETNRSNVGGEGEGKKMTGVEADDWVGGGENQELPQKTGIECVHPLIAFDLEETARVAAKKAMTKEKFDLQRCRESVQGVKEAANVVSASASVALAQHTARETALNEEKANLRHAREQLRAAIDNGDILRAELSAADASIGHLTEQLAVAEDGLRFVENDRATLERKTLELQYEYLVLEEKYLQLHDQWEALCYIGLLVVHVVVAITSVVVCVVHVCPMLRTLVWFAWEFTLALLVRVGHGIICGGRALRELARMRSVVRACRAAKHWVSTVCVVCLPGRFLGCLADDSAWSEEKLISLAVASAYSLVTITPLVDDVTHACRIVWNAESLGWGDLGPVVMFALHLALTLVFAYVSTMTTYAVCARPDLAGPIRIVHKLDAIGMVALTLGWLVLVTVTVTAIGFVYDDEDATGVMGHSRRLIRIVSLEEYPFDHRRAAALEELLGVSMPDHRWVAALEALLRVSMPIAMVVLSLELAVATCALWARITRWLPVVRAWIPHMRRHANSPQPRDRGGRVTLGRRRRDRQGQRRATRQQP